MYGPAVCCKRETSKQRRWVLHQCIRPICGALRMLLAIMDMSAHSISLAAKPQTRAVRVTSSRLRREDRSSIALFHTLADLGGKASRRDGALMIFPCSAGNSLSPFFNRDDGCKQKITLWPCLFKRASFFVRFEWPFLRPGLGTERRRAQGLSRRAGGPREAAWS